MASVYQRPSTVQQIGLYAGVAGLIAGTLGMLVTFIIGVAQNNSGLIYCAMTWIAFLIPLSAGLWRGRQFDPFEPINLVALAIFYGSTLRSIWLLTNSDSSRVDFIMWNTTFDQAVANAPLILMSIFFMTLGYAMTTWRYPIERFDGIGRFRLSRNRFWFAIYLTVAISMIGIPWMIAEYGISFSNGVLAASTKKAVEYVGEDGDLVYGAGFQRYLGSAVAYGFNLLGAAMIAGLVRTRSADVFVLLIIGLLACVTPFLTSSRSSIVLLLLNLAIFAFYYSKLSARTLIIVFTISVSLLSVLGMLREANQTGALTENYSAVDRVLGSGNSIDFMRTSAIIDRVPEVVDYQYGRSYAALVGAVVPRAVWPNKPQVALGPFVKGQIFGEDVRLGGWPSGLVAEGWINFGVWGLVVPLFLFGGLLRIVYETARPLLGISFPITLIYATSIWRLGFGTVGLNFAHGLTQMLIYMAPIAVLLAISRKPMGARVHSVPQSALR